MTLQEKAIEEKAVKYSEIIQSQYDDDYLDTIHLRNECRRAYLAGATEALASQWISVDDELPEEEQFVLVAIETNTNHRCAYAWYYILSDSTIRWYSYDDTFHLDKITHWMRIPEPPKPSDQ